MPVYVYRIVRKGEGGSGGGGGGDGRGPDETFEVRQSIHDPPLTRHPATGEAVERVLCPPRIGRGGLSNSDVAAAGFTKYVKTRDGTYEKHAGRGPGHVDPHGS